MRRLAAASLTIAALAACGSTTTETVTVGQSSTATAATTSGPNLPNTYTSPSEHLHFNYPADWTLRTASSLGHGDAVTLTSPAGTTITWDSDVQGIGGTCPPGSAPNVVITKVTPSTSIAGTYIVTTVVSGAGDSIELTKPPTSQPPPHHGNTGSCVDIPAGFAARRDSTKLMWLIAKRPTVATDEPTVLAILGSASY